MPPSLLRAFRHPLVILSIFVLLFNDHLLKAITPSWLTGKLSDFAGLFFFPFLVGVAIQAAAGILRSPGASTLAASRRFLLAGMLLTALSFTAIKTLPAVNDFAVNALSIMLGLPVRIVRDPTDLLALLSLALAWWLWQRIQANRPSPASGKLAYAALGLGALASLATSPCPPIISIRSLATGVDTVYAAAPQISNPSLQSAYASRDQGITWESTEQLPEAVRRDLSEPAVLPKTVCDPANLQTCYRIDGRPLVEESRDGGQTWETAWELPANRIEYIRRSAAKPGSGGSCGKAPDLRTFDALFVSAQGEPLLLIAMGNEGLLVHTASVGWQRTGVNIYTNGYRLPTSPMPTSYQATTFGRAMQMITSEWLLAIAIAFLVYLVSSALAWVYTAIRAHPEAKEHLGWVFSPVRTLAILTMTLLFAGLAGLLLPGLHRVSPGLIDTLQSIWWLGVMLVPLVILILSIVIWKRAGKLFPRPKIYSRLAWLTIGLGLLVFAIIWAVFTLWAFGSIPQYDWALRLTIAAVLVIVIVGNAWMLRIVHRMASAT